MAFFHKIQITKHDIDEVGHVNNVVYIRWVQEVAEAHWVSVAAADVRARYAWIVLRHEVDYRNPAFLEDEVLGATWVGAHHGPKFERFVKLSHANSGKIFVEAKTIWCLLDKQTLKPLRIPPDVLALL